LALIATVAVSTVAAITPIATINAVAAVFLSATAMFAALSVSGCRHPGCRAQSGQRRDEGFLHVEAPVCILHILANLRMGRAA
jgi:FtsH-binding integral membrane protein